MCWCRFAEEEGDPGTHGLTAAETTAAGVPQTLWLVTVVPARMAVPLHSPLCATFAPSSHTRRHAGLLHTPAHLYHYALTTCTRRARFCESFLLFMVTCGFFRSFLQQTPHTMLALYAIYRFFAHAMPLPSTYVGVLRILQPKLCFSVVRLLPSFTRTLHINTCWFFPVTLFQHLPLPLASSRATASRFFAALTPAAFISSLPARSPFSSLCAAFAAARVSNGDVGASARRAPRGEHLVRCHNARLQHCGIGGFAVLAFPVFSAACLRLPA